MEWGSVPLSGSSSAHRATASPNTRREWLINFYQKRISLHTLYLLFPGPRTGPRTHPYPPPQIDIQVNYYYESAGRFHATQSGVYCGMKYNNQTRRKNTKTHPLGNYTRILTKYEYFVQRRGITGLLCVLFTIWYVWCRWFNKASWNTHIIFWSCFVSAFNMIYC